MSDRPAIGSYDIRDFVPDDVDACLDVFDSNVPDFFRTEERSDFGAFLDALPGPYLVITDPVGQVVACGGYALGQSDSVDLCWGMVRRPLHGVGLGHLLTDARLDRAAALLEHELIHVVDQPVHLAPRGPSWKGDRRAVPVS